MKKDFFNKRDKAILVGLYLSKFDIDALRRLGFKGFSEAFNTIGYTIGTKPASIKNYRDEFDPLFPNERKGWHKRQIRDYCKRYYDDFGNLDFTVFTELIKSFLIDNYDIEKIVERIEKPDRSETVAKRLITGKAAEEYFKQNYVSIAEFFQYEIKDTTNLACGFDFKLTKSNSFYCVEVKGLNTNSGNISLTEKEFLAAKKLKSKYCLFIVMNFVERPFHKFFYDPLHSELSFKKVERSVVQVNFMASIY